MSIILLILSFIFVTILVYLFCFARDLINLKITYMADNTKRETLRKLSYCA